MELLDIDNIKNSKNQEITKFSELSLRERREKVRDELKKENLTTLQLNNFLYIFNTNEDLIYRYIISLNEEIAKGVWDIVTKCLNNFNLNILKKQNKTIVCDIIKQYSNYMSITKLNDLKQKIYGNSVMGFRNISYKTIFFSFLTSIQKGNIEELKINLGKLNVAIKERKVNNQPFDIDNFDHLYFYFCTLLSTQFENNKNNNEKYFKALKRFLLIFKEKDEYSNNDNYEIEKKDIKKFIIIIMAILNLDSNNYEDISQVSKILNPPSLEEQKEKLSVAYKDIKRNYGLEIAEEFKKEIEKSYNFFTLDYKFVEDKIELSEESYLYDSIIKNNIFKKYEKKIMELLDIIFNSDLIKQLLRTVYGEDYERVEHILEKEYPIKKFWENVILFLPFKIKRISGFSYRDLFKIFIVIYKLKHFTTNLENEIFTLGAFVRTLVHERLGHFIVSYLFFMFYANINDKDRHYYSPRMEEKIEQLKKKNYIKLIGNTLAKIEFDIINKANYNIQENEVTNNLNLNNINNNYTKEFYEMLENNLFEEFKKIIGNQYAKLLSQKLIENKKREVEIQKDKEPQNPDINNLKDEKEKNNILSRKAEEIIDILFQFISDDFYKIIKDLDFRQEAYKSSESGCLIEILLFNDFSQYMTLKECLFLLNEENYKNTNLFIFRSEFKNIPGKNNESFLKELKEGNKIFGNLFGQYYSIYENNIYVKQDFIISKNFRENSNNNLTKKYETFKCYNIKIDDSILSTNPDFICKF